MSLGQCIDGFVASKRDRKRYFTMCEQLAVGSQFGHVGVMVYPKPLAGGDNHLTARSNGAHGRGYG